MLLALVGAARILSSVCASVYVSARQDHWGEIAMSGERVAIVTGAGRGIGRAIAIALAQAGYSLCIAARSREQLEETRALSGLPAERALIVLIDLADTDAPESLLDTTIEHYGRIDVLVNNAGWAPPRTMLTKTRTEDQDRMLALNLRAPIALTRLAAIRMTEQGSGAIVNIASSAARKMPAGEAVYAATKAGLVAFTHASFAELRQHGVKLGLVTPGLVDTALIPNNKRLDRNSMLSPADVARAVMQIVESPVGACQVEITLEPQFDPERPR
jgi:short-subunit dehydrogenase